MAIDKKELAVPSEMTQFTAVKSPQQASNGHQEGCPMLTPTIRMNLQHRRAFLFSLLCGRLGYLGFHSDLDFRFFSRSDYLGHLALLAWISVEKYTINHFPQTSTNDRNMNLNFVVAVHGGPDRPVWPGLCHFGVL